MQALLQARNDSDAAQTETAKTAAQKRVLADNRPEAVAQREVAEMINNSPRVLQQRALSDAIHNSPRMVAQRHEMDALFGGAVKPQEGGAMLAEASPAQREEKTNNTGLPNRLKSGIESLSGMSMDHVKVHYNSDKPAQLQAHAYAQGNEIHLGAGQERHLPHEAWHVVQQAQGRVRPTLQMKAGAVNDDSSLEKEADLMGAKAARLVGDHEVRNLVGEERVAGVETRRLTGPALPFKNSIAQYSSASSDVVQRVKSPTGGDLPELAINYGSEFLAHHIADNKSQARRNSQIRGERINTVATTIRWDAAINASPARLPANDRFDRRIARTTCRAWVFEPQRDGTYDSADVADITVWVGGRYYGRQAGLAAQAGDYTLWITHLES